MSVWDDPPWRWLRDEAKAIRPWWGDEAGRPEKQEYADLPGADSKETT